MAEPKHVYRRNLKTPESQPERLMGIPLLHIRGGQRTYLLGQSNYEGSFVLDLCTPSGKGSISGGNRAGAGADINFTIRAASRISIAA